MFSDLFPCMTVHQINHSLIGSLTELYDYLQLDFDYITLSYKLLP